MVSIDAKQLARKPVQIGTLGGMPVFHAVTKGGFNLLSVAKAAGNPEVIATAPHIAIARIIAKKRKPEIKFTTLAKGDYVEPASVEWMLPKWEGITNQVRKLHGDE